MSTPPGPARDVARDRGTVTVFVAAFAPVVFLMLGLVHEGGQHLAHQRAARNAAAGAARAGAQAIDEAHIRGGGRFNALDPAAAEDRACDYLAAATGPEYDVGCGDGVTISFGGGAPPTEITVEVTLDVPVRLLPGLSATATGEGTSCAEFGVSGAMGLCD